MKHGDQGKGKTAKAASQASATRGKTVTVLKGGKAAQSSSKAAGENGKGGGGKKAGAESSSAKAGAEKSGRLPLPKAADAAPGKKDDTGKAHRAADTGPFNNPIVGNAFKRAVAKYPNAFRKLTD